MAPMPQMKPLILSFGHRKNTGKDSVCRFILSHIRMTLGRDSQIVIKGFADEVKNMAHRLYCWAGLRDSEYYEHHYEEKEKILPLIGKTPRELWIGVGNTMRMFDPNVWLNALLKEPGCKILLIKDMGFVNEFKAVKEAGGYCIRVIRPGIAEANDDREVQLIDAPWDHTIYNNLDLKHLHEQALQIIASLGLDSAR